MQLGLDFRQHGGSRNGAGRKRARNVQHLTRGRQVKSCPVLVTLRARGAEVGNLRETSRFAVIKKALVAAKERLGVRLVHWTVLRDHLHLIVECEDQRALSGAMKGLQVRIARALNVLLRRKGCVFTDRYDARRLKSPREVRHALAYVLLNFRHHNVRRFQPGQMDSCSSGQYFDGWLDAKPSPTEPSPVAEAQCYLLAVLWKKYQPLISIHEVPGKRK